MEKQRPEGYKQRITNYVYMTANKKRNVIFVGMTPRLESIPRLLVAGKSMHLRQPGNTEENFPGELIYSVYCGETRYAYAVKSYLEKLPRARKLALKTGEFPDGYDGHGPRPKIRRTRRK